MTTDPLLTVIVPAYNVQGYLRQAVMSVAGDSRVEVVIVDDRSTDDTRLVADQLEELFPSVRVVRPDANGGLGRARNLGMRHAAGEYIVFLDGDDYLAPGAIDKIAEAIDAAHSDVVVFGYSRLYPNGTQAQGMIREPLADPSVFVARDRLDIYTVLNVAWNKAYRREFLENIGLQFPTGYYEDIPWTYPALASAESIITIDQPLYLYRQRGSGSILRSTDRRHLEIIDQFERLMAQLDGYGIDGAERRYIFDCAFRNLATLLTIRRERIPRSEFRGFYRRVQSTVRGLAPEGYAPPTTGDKHKVMAWVWSDPYLVFAGRTRGRAAYHGARTQSRRVARAGMRLARWAYHHPRTYPLIRRTTRIDEQLVVCESLWGRSPRLNCLAVAEEVHRAYPGKRVVWLLEATETRDLPPGTEYAVHGSNKYYRVLSAAKYLFVDANLPGFWRKRAGQVLTQLHHGTPLKLMGVEERGKSQSWRNGLLARCATWDFSVVANGYSAEVWKHSYPVQYETLEVGYPRNDVLVNANEHDRRAARAGLGIGDEARVILYAPTFREMGASVSAGLDVQRFVASLDEGDVLLLRGHYFYGGDASEPLGGGYIDVSDYPSIEALYLAADLLITDYSSAMFDYANLARPIIIFSYDWAEYSRNRGTYFDITVDAPGAVVQTTDELIEVIRSHSYSAAGHQERLQRFAAIFCEFDSGTAARDVVTRVIGGKRPESRPERASVPALASWNVDRLA